jgi:hypothetical protein
MLPNPISKPPIVAMMLLPGSRVFVQKEKGRKIDKLDQFFPKRARSFDWLVALSTFGNEFIEDSSSSNQSCFFFLTRGPAKFFEGSLLFYQSD